MTKLYLAMGVAMIGTAFGCAVAPQEDSASTDSALVARAVDCHAANLTPAQVAACIDNLKTQIPQPLYCDGSNGQPMYECVDFSNTFCDALHGSNYACAEVGVSCTSGGHSVTVVYMGGGCYAVEPQPTGGAPSVIGGPWPAENGSCNTFPPSIADGICKEVGIGTAECTQFYHEGNPEPHGGAFTDCRDVARPAAD